MNDLEIRDNQSSVVYGTLGAEPAIQVKLHDEIRDRMELLIWRYSSLRQKWEFFWGPLLEECDNEIQFVKTVKTLYNGGVIKDRVYKDVRWKLAMN